MSATGQVMKITTDGMMVAQFFPEEDNLRDLAFDGERLWAVDPFGTLWVYTTGGDLEAVFEELLPSGCWGLTEDGDGRLWASNQLTDTLYLVSNPYAVEETFYGIDRNMEPLRAAPNPFRSGVTIRFSLPESGETILRVYNSNGTLVRTLADGVLRSGSHAFEWDGRNDRGTRMPAGVYFARMESRSGRRSERLMLLN
jgi:hypothetical protein